MHWRVGSSELARTPPQTLAVPQSGKREEFSLRDKTREGDREANQQTDPRHSLLTLDKIKILNPAHPGGSIITRKRAERHVRRGVARWATADSIQFIGEDHRHASAVASVDLQSRLMDRGYDAIGRMSLDQVQGLPCAGPAVKVFMLQSKRGNGYGTNG